MKTRSAGKSHAIRLRESGYGVHDDGVVRMWADLRLSFGARGTCVRCLIGRGLVANRVLDRDGDILAFISVAAFVRCFAAMMFL